MRTLSVKERIKCEILHFCDGDTVYCLVACPCCGIHRPLYIRIKGIESAEPRGDTKAEASLIAYKWTKLYANTKAELILTQVSSDRYGRGIGDIYIDGRALSAMLVESGDSWYQDHITKRR